MPSEHRRRKDDTWTQDELNDALKGTDRQRRRKEEDGDRRRHRDDGNGSERRRDRDGERRSHRKEEKTEDKRSHHRGRGDSPGVELTESKMQEEDRERLRRERREKRDGGKEEKKSKPRESKSHKIEEDDDGASRRKHRSRDEPDDDKRRHEKDRERRHHDRDSERRHDEDRKRHKEESSRRHEDEGRHHRYDDVSDRRKTEEPSSRRHHRDEEETEEEREKRRQERKEKREREKQKEKESEKEKDREHRKRSDKDREKDRDREKERNREKDRDREKHRDRDRERQSQRDEPDQDASKYRHEKDRYDEIERRNSRHHEIQTDSVNTPNGQSKETAGEPAGGGDDEYNYEEDFEDYEDDFEDEDPDMKALPPRKKKEGEMEEVLRALDEENNRLRLDSRRSNWSDSTELSDERFKEREEEERKSRATQRGKTVINFVSAKQRVMDKTVSTRARQRFDDLSKLIELDVSKYDMFELPPVGEYELYIRSFGRSDTHQAYVQTRDDDIDRDIQTDEIESFSKWTQHPPDQDTAVGGEGITVSAPDGSKPTSNIGDEERLSKFMENIGQMIFTILEEESKSSSEEKQRREGGSSVSFSKCSSQLGMPGFLEGRQVKALEFCQGEPNMLLSVHSCPHQATKEKESSQMDDLSVVCVWNLSQPAYPYRICASEVQINSACFSPTKASILFGGMHDGSMTLWDLRESPSQHKRIEENEQSHLVRFPTYMTAAVADVGNHESPVISVTPVHSFVVGSLKDEETAQSSSGLSFQLSSVDEKATVNLWVVAEISLPDPAGSETDLGLSPGGKIKLLRSSTIQLNNPNKFLSVCTEVKALNMVLNPSDLNHLYIGTDVGCVVHGVRFGNRVYPHSHSSLIDSPMSIVTIDFSPFGHPYFLAGCQDGTLHLFTTKIESPIATWRDFVSGEKILRVRWSRSRPAVFFVLDNNSTIFTFDLVENGLIPMRSDVIKTADAVCMEIGADPNLLLSDTSKPARMVVALDNGVTEVYSISDEMRKQQPLEEDFLASYMDRY